MLSGIYEFYELELVSVKRSEMQSDKKLGRGGYCISNVPPNKAVRGS